MTCFILLVPGIFNIENFPLKKGVFSPKAKRKEFFLVAQIHNLVARLEKESQEFFEEDLMDLKKIQKK